MSELLKKPYQISIWEDQLVDSENGSYYEENKIAVIGSDTMTSLNKVYSPVLKESVNGEQTLSFSLKYKYFDDFLGEYVENPFAKYLINERKVKLNYKDKWYEFIIKEKEEDSEEYTYSYVCTDAFVQELAKNGYGVTFNTELNNNQGTITELAEKTLENTDWYVDKENSDLLQQKVSEPLYDCVVTGTFEVLNVDTGEIITVGNNEIEDENKEHIYIFYSYVINKEVEYVQFLRALDQENWSYDDNNVIFGTNYRITSPVTYNNNSIEYGSAVITIGEILLEHQGYKLVYNKSTTYEPIMGRVVDLYQTRYHNTTQDIYHYIDSEYTTTSLLQNYVSNGSNFSISNTSVSGWSNDIYTSEADQPALGIATYPQLVPTTPMMEIDRLKELVSYLEAYYPTYTNKYTNAFYNSGFTDNASFLQNIAKGQKFLLRIRYNYAAERYGNLIKPQTPTVRALVAKYNIVERTLSSGKTLPVKKIDSKNVYLDFTESFHEANTIIRGGALNEDKTSYILNGVTQVPSRKKVYEDNSVQYIWNIQTGKYEQKTASNFTNYYYTVGTVTKPIPKELLTDKASRIGLFFYNTFNGARWVYIEDVELTKYFEDANGNPLFIDSAPEAKIINTDYYYLKPEEGMKKEEVNLFTSLDELADDLYIDASDIKPIRNEKCEKILSINEEKSNCFNILQSLCETFECWLDINVEHEEDGHIKLNKNNRPVKTVRFKEYAGKNNFAGFRYGINLSSINRSLDSTEFVTKLMVGQPASEYTNNGILSITNAPSNLSGESYILNFDYYLNQGLIKNKDEFKEDINNFNLKVKEINDKLKILNDEYSKISLAYEKAKANLNVYSEGYIAASENVNEALNDFERLTGYSYSSYVQSHPSDAEIAKNKTLQKSLNDIYSNTIQANNYRDLSKGAELEYDELKLKYKGAQSYGLTTITTNGDNGLSSTTKIILSDYLDEFECILRNDTLSTRWSATYNDKDFVEDNIYDYIVINKIPKFYVLQYTYRNIIHTIENFPAVIQIYDKDNNEGMIKKFQIVPTEEYSSSHISLKQKISDLEDEKRELEKDFYSKYSRFILEGTWDSNNYVDPELYYLDAIQVSNANAQPKVSYTINIVEISQIEGYENYDFEIGDKTYVEDTEFFGWNSKTGSPIREEVVISEVEWHLDEPETNIITVQNYKTQFADLFQRISATVQSVQYNQASYARAASVFDANGNIDSTLLVNSLNNIADASFDLTAGGTLRVTDEGLLIRNLTEPGNLLIIKNRGIDRTVDGGRTWLNLISAEGVNTEALTAGTVNTQNILILDGDNPSFRWDKTGLNAYGYSDDGIDLKTYVRYDKYGIYGIQDDEDYVASSIEDIKEKANFGLTWDGFFIKNKYRDGYVSISSTDDIQVVENDIERVRIGAIEFKADGITPERYGMKISNSEGESVLETDDDGNITMIGTIRAAAGEIGGFTIGENELYNGEFGEDNSIFLSTGYESAIPIAGFDDRHIWAIGIGNNFGVDTSGNLYATNAKISGTINATDGVFTGTVNATGGTFLDEIKVGTGDKYIVLQGRNVNSNSLIASSEYIENSSMGWAISGTGDAIFNNVSVRGAIRTAVFEYSEIEAVGGAFLFRPSSSIKNAIVSGNDLILTMEKPNLFQENEWVKLSNVNTESNGINDILNDGGLTHVYRIRSANGKEVILADAALGFIPDIEATYGEWGEITESGTGGREYTSVIFEPPYTDEELEEDPDLEYFPSYVDLKDNNDNFIQVDAPRYDVFFNGRGYIMELNAELETKDDGTTEIHYNEVEITSDTLEREQSGTYIVHRYIGNLYILSTDLEDTTEDFIVADITYPNGERYSRIYSRMTGEREFILKACDTNGSVDDLIGGSLISFGYYTNAYRPFVVPNWSSPKGLNLYELVEGNYVLTEDNVAIEGKIYYKEQYEDGIHNYGIGINSSDNYVNLPERAISLFESTIHPNESVKVSYDYKGILGTLPPLGSNIVNQNIYSNNMAGTQGIFTNNMYIGDASQYIAFYTDEQGQKQLKINASQIVYEINSDTGEEITWEEHIDEQMGESIDNHLPIDVFIESNIGNDFVFGNRQAILTCYVFKGSNDITSTIDDNDFVWSMADKYGNIVDGWTPYKQGVEDGLLKNQIIITTEDVEMKSIFYCNILSD